MSVKSKKTARIAEMEKKIDELEWDVITANNMLEAKTEEAKKSHSNNAALREKLEYMESHIGGIVVSNDVMKVEREKATEIKKYMGKIRKLEKKLKEAEDKDIDYVDVCDYLEYDPNDKIEELEKQNIELRVAYDKDIHYEHSRFKELETECYLLKEKIYVVDAETGEMTDELIGDKWKKWVTPNFRKWRTRNHAERCAYECCDDASDLDLGKYIKYLEDKYEVEEHTLLTDSEDDSEDDELEFNNFDNAGELWCGGSGNSIHS